MEWKQISLGEPTEQTPPDPTETSNPRYEEEQRWRLRPEFIQPSHWRHIVAYATLAYALAYATDHWTLPRFRHAAIVIAIAAGYGIAMEAGQAFVPHRSDFLISDAIVNTIGASGVLLWYLVRPYLELRPVTDYFESSS